jgi:alpha-L-fucosidase 2
LWQHYAYALDKEFLARALPTMWSACEFWHERLVKGADGTWECPAEYSPEQGPGPENATAHSQQLVAELFANTIEATKALPTQTIISADEIAKLQDYYKNLDKGLAIEKFSTASGWLANGLNDGDELLREWKYSPYTAGWDGHRHLSHLMCLYPFAQIDPGTREFKAAVNSLRQRGDGATGWSLGWKINLWARAHDGNHARQILRNGLSHQAYDNLFDAHPPFQIDGNFGATAGIAEMLVQSLGQRIFLLPALPALWTAGEVRGLKAIGDYTIDLQWQNSKIKRANIVANQGGTLNLCFADMNKYRIKVNGNKVLPVMKRNLTTNMFSTTIEGLQPGSIITIEK